MKGKAGLVLASLLAGCAPAGEPELAITRSAATSVLPTWVDVDEDCLDKSRRWPGTSADSSRVVIRYFIDTEPTDLGIVAGDGIGAFLQDLGFEGCQLAPTPSFLTEADADSIRAAVQLYSDFTPLRFEEETNKLTVKQIARDSQGTCKGKGGPLLVFTAYASTGGYASIGLRKGGIGCVNLTRGSARSDWALHETGHAIGLHHEHRRSDRKQHIDINDDACAQEYDELPDGDECDSGSDECAVLQSPYDTESIMHYKSCRENDEGCACPRWWRKNCTRTETEDCLIEDHVSFSQHDINGIYRMYERALGKNDDGDGFASALAAGDFDGDGYEDLAVGVPGEEPSGVVMLYRGTGGSTSGQFKRLVAWKRLSSPTNTPGDGFGTALAVGDFDGDTFDDLAVSAPWDVGGGAVYLYRHDYQAHTPGNLPQGFDAWRVGVVQTVLRPATAFEEWFGLSLAAGDFDGDGKDELAVGAPRALGGPWGVRAGQVRLFRSYGAFFVDGGVLRQGDHPPWTDDGGDLFGWALAAGDLNGDGKVDLVVGASELYRSPAASGAAYVYVGGAGGLSPSVELRPTGAGGGAAFGKSIALGSFSGGTLPGGRPDLQIAIGAPGAGGGAGAVFVYRRSATSAALAFGLAQTLAVSGAKALGGVLVAGHPPTLTSADSLYAAVPRNVFLGLANLGAVLAFEPGTATPLQPFALSMGVIEDDLTGASLALGRYTDDLGYPIGRGNKLVVGQPSFNGGAGRLHVRSAVPGETVARRIDQETAQPD
jgi:hypothetical protein